MGRHKNDAAPRDAAAPHDLLTCEACQRHLLVLPFVHQKCQHVVCETCAYGYRDQPYCRHCARDLRTAIVKTQAGTCERVAALAKRAGSARQRQQQDARLLQIQKSTPLHYAEARVARVNNPIVDAERAFSRGVERAGCGGWLAAICCCPCNCARGGVRGVCKGTKFCCKGGCTIVKYTIWFTIAIVLMALVFWPLNYALTGSEDFNNLREYIPQPNNAEVANPIDVWG